MAGKKFINAKLKGYNELQEILVEDGVFKAIAPHIDVDSDCEIEDLGGKLTLPPYVDPHIHLDYVFTARKQGATNGTGTLFEGIQRWSETKSDLTIDEIKARAIKAVKMEVSHGVQFIRTHADVTDPNLTALKALLELKEELKDIVTIQIVSFPQEGMYSYKDGDKLVEEGLKMGADCVGGIPHFEYCREFGEKSIHKVVELAVKYDKLIDVHCDESDDPMSRFVELLTALSIVEGIGPKTTASHTCSLGSVDNSFRMMKNFKKAGLNFISCPTENIYLQGRQDTYPKRRGLTRVKELYENGINVCFAQDSIQDPWYPAGNGNLMNVLDNGIHIAQMMSFEEMDNCLDLITVNGAKTMNISDIYGIEAGKPANFIVVDARSEFEAVCERADVVASVRNGEYLFKKAPVAFEALSEFMA
jgi:cytosine deaminase